MKEKNQYHIDVTPEEDSLFRDIPEESKSFLIKKMSTNIFKSSMFWIVFGVHVAVLSVIALASKPNLKEPVPEMVGIDEDKIFVQNPTPTPTPTPSLTPKAQDDAPMDGKPPKLDPKAQKPSVKPDNKFTKEYTIKAGDTIYSVAKKYKLNYDRLIKINNIQDPNKIKVGQKLKFL
jgi:LysM repeat protein